MDDQKSILEILETLMASAFVLPEGTSSFEYLRKLSFDGLSKRYETVTSEIRDRMDYELETIQKTGTTPVFLMLWDIAKFARINDIALSPGVGAAPGSLVLYCLQVTDVDPIRYNLLFERMLNNSLHGLAAFSIVSEHGGSEQLKDYVVKKYGRKTFMLLENMDIDFYDSSLVAAIKYVSQGISIDKGGKIDFSSIDYQDPAIFDHLTVEEMNNVYETFAYYIKNGLEDYISSGYIRGVKVESLEEMSAVFGIDRPGVDEKYLVYYSNKSNPASIQYECPQLEPILAETYGCIVYQEQIMQILTELAGFSPEQSDAGRRDLSKLASPDKVRTDFVFGNEKEGIRGCIGNGIQKRVAEAVFDRLMEMAPYTFTKAHACSYAIMVYQILWLKHYYPEEFLSFSKKRM